jgi:hypothetical protein
MKDKLLDYLKQESTWRGFILIATALGARMAPELQATIVSLGLAIVGIILAARNDTPKPS